MQRRVYLDHNATTPLRAEARDAMIRAMDVVGNPSSVHAEGRAARGLIETARGQIAAAFGAMDAEIIFTSGATEAAALALADQGYAGAAVEHDAVAAWVDPVLAVSAEGRVSVADPARSVLQLANSETGVMQELPEGLALSDLTQAAGKLPLAFSWLNIRAGILSAHKFGGPKGVGALILARGVEVSPCIRGGGQEMGRRAGTENILGIVGMGAAAESAARDVADGVWEKVTGLRIILEKRLDAAEKHIILVGKAAPRLPNTLTIAAPGWKGETQVMAMDLAGFAVSAGSACSSGKMKASKVLSAMGFSEELAASAIRVSLGPETTTEDVERFGDAYEAGLKRYLARRGL